MDYCSPCRRPLNGTVTCPECGAYESDTAPPSDRSVAAPEADPAVWDVLFSEEPHSFESPDASWSPTSPADVPEARRRCPSRLKKYGGRTLAAATFAVLGGLAAASLLPQHSAGTPQALPSPERVSPDEPDVEVTESPTNSRSAERPATRPARGGGVRDRSSAGTRIPRATETPRESPAPRAPAATSPPPPVKARPTPRPSNSRPSQSASSPTATPPASPPASPSASPSASVSASPPSGPTPSTTGVQVPDRQYEIGRRG
ncbi:SCO2400 family protein [Streptomyces xantholiticus]|uniref:SCO2400 family protein n=1 Tax=Streptomyces xantholiticus TaxID=68285 RepID=UPI004032FD83